MHALMTIILVIMIAASSVTGVPPEVSEPLESHESLTTETTESDEPIMETTPVHPDVAISSYQFFFDGVSIKPTEPAEDARSLLDLAKETGEAPSCAFEGLDKVYYFDGFEIQSGLVNNVELITGVILLDETVETAEGLKIGMSLDEMVAIYGDDYREDFGQYVYEDEDVQLIVIVFDDTVISISYIGKFDHVV